MYSKIAYMKGLYETNQQSLKNGNVFKKLYTPNKSITPKEIDRMEISHTESFAQIMRYHTDRERYLNVRLKGCNKLFESKIL